MTIQVGHEFEVQVAAMKHSRPPRVDLSKLPNLLAGIKSGDPMLALGVGSGRLRHNAGALLIEFRRSPFARLEKQKTRPGLELAREEQAAVANS